DLAGPGLLPAQSRPALLTVVLRASRSQVGAQGPLPFPDVVPLGARFREGALGISIEAEGQRAEVNTALARSEPEEDGPWGKTIPDYFYLYRGQPLQGSLTLLPRPPRLRARCTSEVYLAAGRAAVDSHLLLEAEAGSPDTLDLFLSADTVK